MRAHVDVCEFVCAFASWMSTSKADVCTCAHWQARSHTHTHLLAHRRQLGWHQQEQAVGLLLRLLAQTQRTR